MKTPIKFLRAHFDVDGKLLRFTPWGFIDDGFASPNSISGEDKKRSIDCLYSGLKDDFGHEIYDGDRIEHNGVLYQVLFFDAMFNAVAAFNKLELPLWAVCALGCLKQGSIHGK